MWSSEVCTWYVLIKRQTYRKHGVTHSWIWEMTWAIYDSLLFRKYGIRTTSSMGRGCQPRVHLSLSPQRKTRSVFGWGTTSESDFAISGHYHPLTMLLSPSGDFALFTPGPSNNMLLQRKFAGGNQGHTAIVRSVLYDSAVSVTCHPFQKPRPRD